MCEDSQHISQIVTRCKEVNPDLCVSVKIRILNNVERTIDLAQAIEKAGASFITIHARTIKERNVTPHYEYVEAVKKSVSIPVIYNGGVYSPDDIEPALTKTG